MKRIFSLMLVAGLVACEDKPTHVFFESPSDENLVGTWVGTIEITTTNDVGYNYGSPADRGFNFPVVIDLNDHGGFTLITSGYPTSFDNGSDRTCRGAYTRIDSRSLSFFPAAACRALPMTKYTIGRVAPDGITLTANANVVGNPSASYLPMRVFMRLERD